MKKKLSVLFVVIAAIALCMGVTACAAKNYTVTFTGEGVTETTQTVAEGGTVIEPNDPVRDGFTFEGWYLGEEKYDFSTPVKSDITLTAKWSEFIDPNVIKGEGTKESPYILSHPNHLVMFSEKINTPEEYEDGELDKWVTGGDVAPEGLLFLSDAVSPTGEALLLAACEVSGTVAVYQVGGEPLSVLPFTDVEARDAQAVRYVCENGLMAGVSADRFEPNGTLTRGEAVTALWALEGRPVVNYLMDFSDVDPAASYGEAVRWAASEGIAGGYGGGLFGPDDPITREQLAVMLYRYARHEGYDTAQGGMAVREFADYDQIAGYAAEAMTWAVEAGVLTATSLDTLAPGQAATRVQTAQALLALSQFTK